MITNYLTLKRKAVTVLKSPTAKKPKTKASVDTTTILDSISIKEHFTACPKTPNKKEIIDVDLEPEVDYPLAIKADGGSSTSSSSSSSTAIIDNNIKNTLINAEHEEQEKQAQTEAKAKAKEQAKRYNKNKSQAKVEALKFLSSSPNFKEHLIVYKALKKKDDAADAILQAIYFLQTEKPKKHRFKKGREIPPPTEVSKTVLSYDVGITNLAEAIITQEGSWDPSTDKFTGKYGITRLQVSNIIKENGSKAKVTSVAGAKLCDFLTKYLLSQIEIYEAANLHAIIIEQQPGTNKKMLAMAYYLHAFFQGYYSALAVKNKDFIKPKILFQSAKGKLHVQTSDLVTK